MAAFLTKNDIGRLKKWGYLDRDMPQIERAASVKITTYELGSERISRAKALEILGRETWLSGLARSAFHWSAARNAADGKTVFFDSTRLFA